MSKKPVFLTSMFATLFLAGAALIGHAAPAAHFPTPAPVAATAQVSYAELTPDAAVFLAPLHPDGLIGCTTRQCRSNTDCGFPDVCGGCQHTSGQVLGHCLPTP
jgi:hypothetical protein